MKVTVVWPLPSVSAGADTEVPVSDEANAMSLPTSGVPFCFRVAVIVVVAVPLAGIRLLAGTRISVYWLVGSAQVTEPATFRQT